MPFMNESEIRDACRRHANDLVLSAATEFLRDFMDEVNAHSDGWAHWARPLRAAENLMTLIQRRQEPTYDAFQQALKPIRAFYTRHGTRAGMSFPSVKGSSPCSQKHPHSATQPSHNANHTLPLF
jgi:hypothetical protein